MSYLSPRPEQSTTSEASLLTALANLAVSGNGESIQKDSATTFTNVKQITVSDTAPSSPYLYQLWYDIS